jgi:hypothetical protein
MNLPQRIVLIVGAVVLVAVLCATESHRTDTGLYWDWQTALVRCLVFSLAILAVYFAVGKKK